MFFHVLARKSVVKTALFLYGNLLVGRDQTFSYRTTQIGDSFELNNDEMVSKEGSVVLTFVQKLLIESGLQIGLQKIHSSISCCAVPTQ